MATQCNTSQQDKGNQTSNTAQPKRNPRFAQFPKAPVKPSSSSKEDSGEPARVERILFSPHEEKQQQPPNQNGGENGRLKPGMVRFVRASHNYRYPKANEKKTITREGRRNAAAAAALLLPSSVVPNNNNNNNNTAEDKARQRTRRRASQHIHSAQRTRGQKKAASSKPQLTIKLPAAAAEQSGGQHYYYPSKQWSRVRSILPASGSRVPVARAAAVRFPMMSREASPDEQSSPSSSSPTTTTSSNSSSSPSIPTSIQVCFLCRVPSRGEEGKDGLCNACKTEYTMPPNGLHDNDGNDDDDDDVDEDRGGIHDPPRSYSSSIYSDSSSVYSMDARTPVNDDALTVSTASLDGVEDSVLLVSPCPTVGKACVSETGMQAIYPGRHGKRGAGTGSPDLYDLDWAEYYFNDTYFADVKGVWG
ncbi:hypothetical protein BBK36DRAFT_1110257 [Trichoderma citrinoviride]|uniref:Uncharacterized protein n=1 Tax=Trichoderma citrinoviride TaxID=58853 RepID=A0A2T4BJS3_9HYPO|nr:hypothetical protein BBK36DRAFT_1110257 [Trichoderma citrinoviride]PTB69560.1 hypothetical protein BBK36DRAFT_1110257 [Trichoderma citrinoviride]